MGIATVRSNIAASAFFLAATGGQADVLADLAGKCMAAIQSGDRAAFDVAAEAIKKRQDTFNTDARELAEDCLSEGYGEPWEYDYPSKSWLASAMVEARLQAAEDAARAKQKTDADRLADEARKEAARAENALRVATHVYLSCSKLLARDEVAAMTNPVCVESFLASGLPAVPAP